MVGRLMRWVRRRMAIRSYRRRLGPALRERYGRKRSYTPAQVRTTADVLGLSVEDLCWALAMYTDREAFDADHAARGEACDWEDMRSSLAELGWDASWDGGHAVGLDATPLESHPHDPGSAHHDGHH